MSTPVVRWLDADEQRAWRAYIRGSRLLGEELERGLEQHGLSHPEYEILVRLSETPDHALRMAELASSVVCSRSRLTHTIGRLERAGFVERNTCPGDRRGVRCVLTEHGVTTLRAAAHTHVETVRSCLLDAMTRQQFLTLGASMAKVADHLDPRGTYNV